MTLRTFLVFSGFAISTAATSVSEDVKTRGLGADDACSAAEGSRSSCAVSALQRTSARGGVVASEPDKDLAKSTKRKADEWHWDAGKSSLATVENDASTAHQFWQEVADSLAPRMEQHCQRYNSHFWPQTSFWSSEVLRRVQAVPDNADLATQQRLQDFSRNASFLMCTLAFDPRSGTKWSKPVAEYLQKVRAMPASSLELPLLDGWFESPEARSELWAGDSCMFWANSLMCDIAQVAEDLKGSKEDAGLCWDTIAAPEHGFSLLGVSLQEGRVAKETHRADEFDEHPEYLTCQDKPLTEELLSAHCPMFGHFPKGFLEVEDWGMPFPEGSRQRTEAMKCHRKLNLPQSTPAAQPGVTHRPWSREGGSVQLMSSPPAGWSPVTFDKTHDVQKAFTESVKEAVMELVPGCSSDDWMCVVKALDKQRRQAEAHRTAA